MKKIISLLLLIVVSVSFLFQFSRQEPTTDTLEYECMMTSAEVLDPEIYDEASIIEMCQQ